jgi:hypothetical protein
MSFWEKIQEDLKKNIQEGLEIVKEGSTVFTDKIEQLTGEGKKKYKVFNLNMKVQDEFAKLGGQIYDLVHRKSKNPLGSRSVTATITRINKLESQINKLEGKGSKLAKKKTVKKKTAKKKAVAKKKTTKKTTKTAMKTGAAK